jgi:hypothetical protein
MSNLAKVSRQVLKAMSNPRLAAVDKEADRQRVNSYIADVLKDAHVLYAKLARLHGDFGGTELKELEKVSEVVLSIGGKLASFSKAFNEGKAKMNEPDVYGEGSSSGGGDFPSSFGGGDSDPFATEAPAAPSPSSSEDSGLDFGDAAGGDEESGGGGSDPIDIEFDFEDDDEGGEPEGGKSEAKSEEKKPAKKPAKKSED